MKHLLIFIAFFCIAGLSYSQWVNINHLNQQGTRVGNFEKNGTDLFIASNGGVFKSSDSGANWKNSINGFSPNYTYSDRILKHSTGLYVKSDKYYTSSDGNYWTGVIPTGFPSNYEAFEYEEANDLLFTIVYDMDLLQYNLYYSSDGTSWNLGAFLSDNSQPHKFQFMNFSDTCLYVSVDTLLFHTSDGINLIEVDLSGFPYGQGNFNVRSMTSEPNGEFFYYINESAGDVVYRFSKTTGIWTDVTNNLPSSFAQYNSVKSGDNAVFVSVASFVPSISIDIYRSLDHGATWSVVTSTGLGELSIFDKFAQLSPDEYIFSNVVDEIYYSDDNGVSWSLITNGLLGKERPKLFEVNDVLLTFDYAKGALRSLDNGNTWSYSNNGLSPFFADLYFVGDIYVCGTDIFITFAPDPNTGNYDLYKSTDLGVNWTQLSNIPDSSNIQFAGGDLTSFAIKLFNNVDTLCSYLYTNNGGTSWVDFTTSLDAVDLKKNFGFKGNMAGSSYLFGVNTFGDPVIFLVTSNYGSYYETSNSLEFYWKFRDRGQFHELPICGFASNNEPIIAVPRFDLYPNTLQFYRYDFTGSQWNMITSSGLPTEIFDVSELVNNNGTWYLGAPYGIFKSTDDCVTWTTAIPGNQDLLLGMRPYSIQFINNYIYLGTESNSIWMTDLSTGVQNQNISENMLYPNPATDFVSIQGIEFNKLVIIDIYGKEIYCPVNENNQIDISSLSPGLYMLNIISEEGISTKKFIKL